MNLSKNLFVLKIFIFLIPLIFYSETYIAHKELRKTEKELLEFVNREREVKGVTPLEFNERLYRIAMDHNLKMAKENKLEHNFEGYLKLDERMVKQGIYFAAAGENIAFSNVYPSDFIHSGFVKSRTHYENIIDPKFRHAGIAVLETGNGFYITQEFGDIINDISADKAEERILEFINKSKLFPSSDLSGKIKKNYSEELRGLSAELLKNGKYKKEAEKMEGYDILTMLANKLEQIEAYITSSNKENKYGSFGFAITSGRNEKFRGGVYSFVMALREKVTELSLSLNTMELEIIKVLNNKLRLTTGINFSYSKKLSIEAAKAVKLYYRGDDSLLRNSMFNILAYQCVDPLKIPEECEDFFISNKGKKSIGVKLLRPEENGIYENYFLLAFVFRK